MTSFIYNSVKAAGQIPNDKHYFNCYDDTDEVFMDFQTLKFRRGGELEGIQ